MEPFASIGVYPQRRLAVSMLISILILLQLSRNAAANRLEAARFLQQGDDGAAATDDAVSQSYFAYDLSGYSVHFEKCQYVKAYDDELAQDEDSESPLALKGFVVFRLCPTDSCSSCDADGVTYGKYAVEVDTYLESTVQYQRESLQTYCNTCDRQCNNGDDDSQTSSYCTACSDKCNFYNNLGDNGYLDASDYTECQALQAANNNNGDDDAGAAAGDDGANAATYIGPRCNSKGKIVIGLFADEKCREPIDNQDVETLLGAKLSYHLLNSSYSDEGACVSCMEAKDDADGAGQDEGQDVDNVNEMCETLYNSAAKCESKTGLSSGFIQTNRQDEDGKQENQVQNEYLACTFIDSLIWDSYTETGAINTKEKQDVIIRRVTSNQKVALSLVTLCFGLLFGAAYYLDRKIKNLEASHPLVFRGEHKLT